MTENQIHPILPHLAKPRFSRVEIAARPAWIDGKNATVTDIAGLVLRIETTNHCNFKCTFCPHPTHTRQRQFIDERLFRKIIGEAGALGMHTLDIRNFGEPLVDKRLPKLVAEAREYGFDNIYIHSNGYGLTAEKLEILAESGMTMIILSISPQREFQLTRPGSDYQRLARGLASLRDSKYRKIVSVDYIATGLATAGEISAMKDWLNQLGLPLRTDIQLHNWAKGASGTETVRSPCHRLWTSLTILSDGKVALCCLDYDGEVILGDANNQTVAEILNGEMYREIRTAHLRGEFLDKCLSCDMPLVKDG